MDGEKIALIGFGEAGMAFAPELRAGTIAAFDIKTLDGRTATAKRDDYTRLNVTGGETLAEAAAGAGVLLSLVTADQALAAAAAAAAVIAPGALYFDCNSVAPETKRAAARQIERGGGRYIDVAVMSPVLPKRTAVPLLLSGSGAEAAAKRLRGIGFANVEVVGEDVGSASAVKMLRSVMVKGMEALTAECLLAAHRAGVADRVLASLEASFPGMDWASKADYNIDRMMVHGLRRAAEMDEVAKTLDDLGLGSGMARATADLQRRIGALGLAPADGLAAKVDAILGNGASTRAEAA